MQSFSEIRSPEEFQLNTKKFYLSKLTASEGRQILIMYPSSAPRLFTHADYANNEQIMLQLFKHVFVEIEIGKYLALKTLDLIDNHVDNAIDLIALEKKMFEYNFGFFLEGKIFPGLTDFAVKIEEWATKIAMSFSEQLFQVEKPRSVN